MERREVIRVPVAERAVEYLAGAGIDDPVSLSRARLEIRRGGERQPAHHLHSAMGHRNRARRGTRLRDEAIHPLRERRARGDRKRGARRGGPDADKLGVDEVGEVRRDRRRRVCREDGLADRGAAHDHAAHNRPAQVEPDRIAVGPRAAERNGNRGERSAHTYPLVPPEDAGIVIDLTHQPELLEVPDETLRRELICGVGIEVGGHPDVGPGLRRVRNVARDRAFQEIEIEVPALAAGVLVAGERDHDRVLAGGDAGEQQAPQLASRPRRT